METFPTRGRDIVPVFIHRARVFSFLLDILDISSSSIHLFINISNLICLLFICYLFVYNYIKLICLQICLLRSDISLRLHVFS